MAPIWPLAVLVLAALAAPVAAQSEDPVDVRIELAPDEPPVYDGPAGWFTLNESAPGQRYVWALALTETYAVAEVRMMPLTFDVERPRQVVPLRHEPGVEFPLFQPYPGPDVWNVDHPARVFHYETEGDGTIVLRLGLPGPGNGTLELVRDVTPPDYELDPVANVTAHGFLQESQTDELALGEVQVRQNGTGEDWVEHPTVVYHFRQRFPVVGLDADTLYDVRFHATDWAGNAAAHTSFTVRTLPVTDVAPVVTVIAPTPEAVVAGPDVAIEAHVAHPDGALPPEAVRLFIDAREVPGGLFFTDGETVQHTARGLTRGIHALAVEARLGDGPIGHARWTFTIGDGAEAPALTPGFAVLAVAVAFGYARRTRDSRE